MPVNETETCIAVLRGMLTVCGLCDTEKAAIRYAINKMKREQTVDMDLYGNNSLSGYQQRDISKEEYQKGIIDIIKDKLSAKQKKGW